MQNKKLILLLCSSNPDNEASVASRLQKGIIKQKNYEIWFISRRTRLNKILNCSSWVLDKILKSNAAIRILLFPRYPAKTLDVLLFNFYAIFAIELIEKFIRKKIDLIHLVESSSTLSRYFKFKRIPFIYELNTCTVEYFSDIKKNPGIYKILQINKFLKKGQNDCFLNSSKIIVPSKFVFNQISYDFQKKTKIVPYYIDNSLKIKRKKRINEEMVIGFVGNHSANKGIFQVMSLASKLKNKPVNFKSFGRLYKSINIDKSLIKNNGFSTKENIYSQIDILILLSWGEGSARVIYESISNNIPVICSIESGAPFQEKSWWVSKHNDIEFFKKLILKLLDDKKLISNLIVEQKKQLEPYSLKLYRETLKSIYSSILK